MATARDGILVGIAARPSIAVPPVRHLLRARDVMDARYPEPLTVTDLAGVAGLSRAHFSREFRRAFGESPHQYLRTRRLERAAHLLRTTDQPITDICFAVGFESLGSFTTAFRHLFGRSPGAVRKAAAPSRALPVHIPSCVVQAYLRPQNRTFREAGAALGS